MKTLLDLIQEFAVLNDAKTLGGGVLPPAEEKRWRELKGFYDTLMMQEGFRKKPLARFSAKDIRRRVSNRLRLRVMTDMEVVVQHESDFKSARVENLSCGGALLLCESLFEVGSRLTLHLTHIERREGIIWVEGEVVWYSNGGISKSGRRYRMGVRFIDLEEDEKTKLDSFVIENIENRILSLRSDALSPDFVQRERLVL
jgi:Tfp pilus assembly protein PilZ